MISLLLTAAVLTANPTPVKLASPVLNGVNLKAEELAFYTDHLAQQLGFHGLRVITATEIQQLLGFERQKQLLGCADNSASCQAELANALGVDGLVTGSIGKVGKSLQINLKIIKAEDGTPLAAYSSRASSDEQLLDKLTEAAELLAKSVLQKLNRPGVVDKKPDVVEKPKVEDAPVITELKVDPPQTSSSPVAGEVSAQGGLRPYAWIPAAGGVALAGVGTYFVVTANSRVQQIRDAASDDDAARIHAQGKSEAWTGAALLGVGAAAIAAGAGMYLFGGTTQVALVPGQSPAAVLSGSF